MRAGRDLAREGLDEAAAHLAVAETPAETAPPGRQRRLRVAIASLKLSLATRRGHPAGVAEQARFLASPVTGQSDEDIALDSDLRAVAPMNLGTVDASLGLAGVRLPDDLLVSSVMPLLLDRASLRDGPRLAARQVRGRHPLLVTRSR